MFRRDVLKTGLAAAIFPSFASAQEITDRSFDFALRGLLANDATSFAASEAFLMENATPDLAPSLIAIMRFLPQHEPRFTAMLAAATGESQPRRWFDWMLWQQSHPEIVPAPHFAMLKRDLLVSLDPNFEIFLKPEYITPDQMLIRMEEIAWGGVRKDGIPSLDGPNMIPASTASYLNDDDLVFGIEINGDIRAYPLRIMGWHEMFNDVIGGVPVAMAYCTLCGSGILFETAVQGRAAPLVFGSSGFLYRSNKLMFDRETHSLWNQFTGEPVVGPLVGSGIVLEQRAITIEPWGKWRARNPGTQVLSLQTGHQRDYGSGVVYNSYFASDDLMFPVLTDQNNLKQKEYVFGIRLFGGAKAWPLSAFAGGQVINDALGGTELVLIGDAEGRNVRAYERQGQVFSQGGDAGELLANAEIWSIGEDALTSQTGERLPRVAGHIAYWFAWDGYLGAESELYGR